LDWAKTFIFWGDERCVPPDDEGSNYRQAMDTLLSHVSIPDENIQRIKGELEPADASRNYAHILKAYASPNLNWPRFDLVLLGMGQDGHTASLFPGSKVETASPTQAVTANYQGRPANRVTLTSLVFNSARKIFFLVTGESKATTLARVINGEHQPEELPAQRIRPTNGKLIWLVDEAAGSKL
jgi:6-phosphogluconolactonase